MQKFFPSYCAKCDEVHEANFTFAGPHLKQTCLGCNSYIKFFPVAKLPDKKEIGFKIMSMQKDVDIIKAAKTEIGFVDGLKGVEEKIQYWRLYLHFLKIERAKGTWNYKP